jgi:chitinase
MQFSPNLSTQAEFTADVQTVQARGQKVIISIGGAGTSVKLNSETEKQAFINSMISINEQYGFDGLDIDLEGSSLSLDSGDSDFRSPTTLSIVRFIDAIKAIVAHFGSDFILTAAPETAFVQGGWNTYGGIWGAYLPVLHALRGDLTLLHVQHYNTGTMFGADGVIYTPGTADFHVAMADMLLRDFPVGRNPSHIFPALRPDQVAIGLPASINAAGKLGHTELHLDLFFDKVVNSEAPLALGFLVTSAFLARAVI